VSDICQALDGGSSHSHHKKGGGAAMGFLKFLIVMLFLGAQGAIGYWAYEKYDLQRYVPEQVKEAGTSPAFADPPFCE